MTQAQAAILKLNAISVGEPLLQIVTSVASLNNKMRTKIAPHHDHQKPHQHEYSQPAIKNHFH